MKNWLLAPLAVLVLSQPAFAAEEKERADGPPPPPHMGRMFKDMDKDGDGAISKEESQAFHAERFDKMDANHDGKLTREELKKARPPHPPRDKMGHDKMGHDKHEKMEDKED